ncbi:MAG TPA: LytTR family DNA-binding domain-containing protein [Mobilitalea sp.]|nr:LytTR family DNA-binding domain-containing protein [Mobilitalea sp.]
MNKYRIAACDDNRTALDIIANAIINCFQMHKLEVEMETFTEVKSLKKRLSETEFHLLVLDIDMPVMDGITFGKELRAHGNKTSIIFASNREDKVFDSLKVQPDGFIRKSHIIEDIPEVIEAYLQAHREEVTQKLVIQNRDQLIVIPLDDILYIEGNLKYQMVHVNLKKDPIPLRRPMQELEEELSSKGFLRIHKGYLANYKHIRIIMDLEIELDNNEKLPISRRKIQEVKASFMDLMQNKGTIVFK